MPKGSTVRGFGAEDYDRVRSRIEADERLAAFVAESNRIEGIHRPPTDAEIKAHRTLIARKRVNVEHVSALVAVCQPNAVLRATSAVGQHRQRGADAMGGTRAVRDAPPLH